MAGLLSLLVQLAGISTQRVGERLAGLSVLFAVALAFLLLGITGLAAALWILLARLIDPLLAALLIGSVSTILAGILLLVAKSHANADHLLYGRKKRPQAPETPDSVLLMLPLAVVAIIGFALSSRKPKA